MMKWTRETWLAAPPHKRTSRADGELLRSLLVTAATTLGVTLAIGCHKDQATADVADAAPMVIAPVDAAVPTTVASMVIPDPTPIVTAVLDPAAAAALDGGADAAAGREFPTTWSDPRVVSAIAKSCAFDPTKLPPREQTKRFGPHRESEGAGDNTDDLGCTGDIFPQACAPDPCAFGDEADACRNDCVKTCGTCSDTCVSTCNDCESACTDDACRQACAKKTATCRIGCQRARDTCGNKGCDAVIAACYFRVKKEFKELGCSAACKTKDACMDACERDGGDGSTCMKKCVPPGKEKCAWEACGDPQYDPQ